MSNPPLDRASTPLQSAIADPGDLGHQLCEMA